ncbi:HlyD family efflux transporter periplasmic adaptor subunit [Aquimarina sp. U1-2]|uniref:HlyD family secretion protein n=1 Tax=Aquimarina sp. U1-2 TaxID=2823141 RepID=UPI001AEC8234|nr:HlyD family efflux transporter periplasmic adaptor subunit [Aquimarina sp. U1-2]MBP2831023.1 HlyD family efflux transporter periplasmic adaptor subunit [Aquimarina sp. U1-2]
MKNTFIPIQILIVLTLLSCGDDNASDAYGNFIANETTVSAKATGELISYRITEGIKPKAGEQVGLIDTVRLHLEKLKVQAQITAIDDKLQTAAPEVAVLLEQRENLQRERNRTARLVAQKAATQKQLDDYEGDLDQINQRISSTRRMVSVANRGILAERKPLEAQIRLLNRRIQDHIIYNPIQGTILSSFVEPNEFVTVGAPLYQVATLDTLILRAYTSALLLQNVKLNDRVIVRIDKDEKRYTNLSGTVTFISDDAEFTPKSIQTKEERIQLVYAIEVAVKNNGILKIGMPGEVVFPINNKE